MDMVLKYTISGPAQLGKKKYIYSLYKLFQDFLGFFTFSKPVNHNFKIPWYFQVFCGNPAQIGGVCLLQSKISSNERKGNIQKDVIS